MSMHRLPQQGFDTFLRMETSYKCIRELAGTAPFGVSLSYSYLPRSVPPRYGAIKFRFYIPGLGEIARPRNADMPDTTES